MVSFYKHLKKHERKDDALRAAMLEEMRYPETHGGTRAGSRQSKDKVTDSRSNAYYWAAFQVIGDCKPLDAIPGG
jgi:CHAT domain-containing protein